MGQRVVVSATALRGHAIVTSRAMKASTTPGAHAPGCVSVRRALVRIAFLLLLVASSPLAADKTDVVILENGDQITGEVKKLERGKLTYKTDHMGTLQIEWKDIARVTSRAHFEVENVAGEIYYGVLGVSPDAGRLAVTEGAHANLLDHMSVVKISPIEETFWGRLDGSLSLGLTFAQASDTEQLALTGDATYRTRKIFGKLAFSHIRSRQASAPGMEASAPATERTDLNFQRYRFLGHRWFAGGLLTLQGNEELGLDLRTLVGGGGGRHLIQNNRTDLMLTLALAASRERLIDSEDVETSAEGILRLLYQTFTFDTPELDITADLQVFPSLTISGRVRVELSIAVKRELIKDFFWNLSLLESFDSQPPGEGAEKSDLVLTASLGWSF
jgi:hypothetical protein